MKKQYISPNASVYNLKLEGGMLCLSMNYNNNTIVDTDDLNSTEGAWTNKKDEPFWGSPEEGNGYW